jgi:hypothetical protein
MGRKLRAEEKEEIRDLRALINKYFLGEVTKEEFDREQELIINRQLRLAVPAEDRDED